MFFLSLLGYEFESFGYYMIAFSEFIELGDPNFFDIGSRLA